MYRAVAECSVNYESILKYVFVCLCLMHFSDYSDFMLLTLVYRALTVLVGLSSVQKLLVQKSTEFSLGHLTCRP